MALLLVTAVVAGCAGFGTPGQNVAGGPQTAMKYVHDDARKVGCWYVVGGGGGSIACLPDSQYTVVP